MPLTFLLTFITGDMQLRVYDFRGYSDLFSYFRKVMFCYCGCSLMGSYFPTVFIPILNGLFRKQITVLYMQRKLEQSRFNFATSISAKCRWVGRQTL